MNAIEAATVDRADYRDLDEGPRGDVEGVDYDCLNKAQMKAAVQLALDEIGCTYEELHEQALADDFISWEARDTWFVIKHFAPPCDAWTFGFQASTKPYRPAERYGN